MRDSIVEGGFGGFGGALHIAGGQASIFASFFIDNSAYLAGGAIMAEPVRLVVEDSGFFHNGGWGDMAYGGGAIFCYGCDLTLRRVVFSDNQGSTSTSGYGGGAVVVMPYHGSTYATLVASDVVATRNDADSGGAIAAHGDATTMALHNVSLMDNTARFGGGLYSIDSHVSLTNSVLSGNVAQSGGGAWLPLYAGHNPTIHQCVFDNNAAGVLDGGMCSLCLVVGATFLPGHSHSDWLAGGGVNFGSPSDADSGSETLVVTNSMFSSNRAPQHGGGAINGNIYVEFEGCSFYNNSVLTAEGGGKSWW